MKDNRPKLLILLKCLNEYKVTKWWRQINYKLKRNAQKDGIYFTCRFWKVEPFQLFSVEYKSINNNNKNYKNITWSSCKITIKS